MALQGLPASDCCTFRGSLVKIDVDDGRIIWQTFTLPDNGGRVGGYSGASIWGSSPAIDVRRGLVYVGTGQSYTAPQEVYDCQANKSRPPSPSPFRSKTWSHRGLLNLNSSPPPRPSPNTTDECIGPDVYFDSIIAFDIRTGEIRWGKQLEGYDVFNFQCLVPNNPTCPLGPNKDADFGEAPMLVTVRIGLRSRDIVVAVQKSGVAWALDRDNGDIVWFQIAGPGGKEGGGIRGSATDGNIMYTNIANTERRNFTLSPTTQVTKFGGWVALSVNNGDILWSTANDSALYFI